MGDELNIDQKKLTIYNSHVVNESNLMTIPIFSLKRKKKITVDGQSFYRDTMLSYTWKRGNTEVGLRVVGSSKSGCPTIHELEVYLGLMKLATKSQNNLLRFEDGKVNNFPRRIYFTYRELAKVLGYSGFGKKTKESLENAIQCMNETTIYSDFALRNQETKEYIADFNGSESFRLLENYCAYSVTRFKKANKSLLSSRDVKEYQSVEIGEFFYKNLCNGYLKLLNFDLFLQLTRGMAKKLMLLLTQWSHGSEKILKIQTVYSYLGVDVNSSSSRATNKRELKLSLTELVDNRFLASYKFLDRETLLVKFPESETAVKKLLVKYTTEIEVVVRLREIGFEYDEIGHYCTKENLNYVAALLRYTDYRQLTSSIDHLKAFVLKGLVSDAYNVKDFLLEV